MHRRDAAPAPHQPVRRHRRVDAAGQQADDPAADAGGHAARSGFLAEVIERFARERLDVNGEVGLAEVDLPAARVLDAPAHFALDLRRRQRKAFVGAPRGDAKTRRAHVTKIGEDRCGQRVDIEHRASRARKVCDAERVADAVGNSVPGRGRAEHELDAPHARYDLPHVEIARGMAKVAHQPTDEPGPVAPFQCDLLVMNDDGIHETASAARRPLTAAPSIVAGRPLSTQSLARNRRTRLVRVPGLGG